MAIGDLDLLHEDMPDLFRPREVPGGFDEDWAFERVRRPDYSDGVPEWWSTEQSHFSDSVASPGRATFETYREVRVPKFGEIFPGATVPVEPGTIVPPPDALGFYLPFHSYHPTWWGIYLIAEGVEALAGYIEDHTQGELDWLECVRAAQLFIYFHEAFHHATECCATRLEIVVRQPLKVGPFEAFYRARLGTGDCVEEALACGHALAKTGAAFASEPEKRDAAEGALLDYVYRLPPDYARGADLMNRTPFVHVRNLFAEDNLLNALPDTPQQMPGVWHSFPHAFSGIGRVNSRVNYIVHRSSPLFQRISAGGYYLTKRELTRKLSKLAGCVFDHDGGNHEVWAGPAGKFAIPRHPGDISTGTLGKIIKQAGLDMSVAQFVATRVWGGAV